MSATAVSDVLDRSMRDDAFLDAFRADPDRAVAGYDLEDREADALLSGDDGRIHDVLGDLALDDDGWVVSVVVVVLG